MVSDAKQFLNRSIKILSSVFSSNKKDEFLTTENPQMLQRYIVSIMILP